jgi:hypothetical protein
MTPVIIRIPVPASPCVDDVLKAFLGDQKSRLKLRTYRRYEQVVDLLRGYMNGYAYEGLSKAELGMLDRYSAQEGDEHRSFCQLFGPEWIPESFGMFHSWFMARKVMCGREFKRTARTVTGKLATWLKGRDFAEPGIARDHRIEHVPVK